MVFDRLAAQLTRTLKLLTLLVDRWHDAQAEMDANQDKVDEILAQILNVQDSHTYTIPTVPDVYTSDIPDGTPPALAAQALRAVKSAWRSQWLSWLASAGGKDVEMTMDTAGDFVRQRQNYQAPTHEALPALAAFNALFP